MSRLVLYQSASFHYIVGVQIRVLLFNCIIIVAEVVIVSMFSDDMLTIKEAASYFNIGTKKMRRIAEDNFGNIAVFCGNRSLIVRPKFEEFILNSSEI